MRVTELQSDKCVEYSVSWSETADNCVWQTTTLCSMLIGIFHIGKFCF